MSSIPKQTLHALYVGTVAGLAGGLVAGIASRLAMRVSGALTVAANRGISTEAGFTVGRIVVEDAIFLVLFCAYLGIFGGLAYMSAKPWIPSAGRARGLWFGSLLLVLFAPLVIESANPDFILFGPPALNLVTFSSLFLLFGLVTVPVADRIDEAGQGGRLMAWIRIPAAIVGALAVVAMIRILVVGAWPGPDAAAAGSLAEEMIRALFNGLRYHEIALSPTQILTVGVILYVLMVLPLVRLAVRPHVGRDTQANSPPCPVPWANIAFALPVLVGVGVTAWEFVAILGNG